MAKITIPTDTQNRVTLKEALMMVNENFSEVYNFATGSSELTGKKLVAIGDSISTYTGNYITKSTDKLGMPFVNFSAGGKRFVGGTEPIVTQYAVMDNDAELILIAGGSNDWQHNIPLGTRDDRVVTTFYGALHIVALGLKEKYLGKPIIFLTPIKRIGFYGDAPEGVNSQGKMLKDYADAIIDVCGYYGIYCLDMFRECAINPHIPTWKTAYIPDGTHPNDDGYKLMERNLTAFLKSIY